MNVPLWVWIAVCTGIAAIFVVSLVFGRRAHVISVGEAARWVIGYVLLAVLFGIGVGVFAGSTYAGQFFAGYVTEYALSVDNLFVFAILLAAFQVPRTLQGRVVLIGIGIALVLRGVLIAVGAALIASFSWVFYLFGIFLVITAINVAKEKRDEGPKEPKTVAWMKRRLPLSDDYHGTRFTIRKNGRRLATPLLAVVLALGVTDLIFALDSIPAIFGLTQEPFLVFTANAFALLGLSELYFVLGALLQRLRYLSVGLGLILLFIGVKLILEALADNTLPFINGGEPVSWAPHITPAMSLAVVGTILAVTVVASLIASQRDTRRAMAEAAAATDDEPGDPSGQDAGDLSGHDAAGPSGQDASDPSAREAPGPSAG